MCTFLGMFLWPCNKICIVDVNSMVSVYRFQTTGASGGLAGQSPGLTCLAYVTRSWPATSWPCYKHVAIHYIVFKCLPNTYMSLNHGAKIALATRLDLQHHLVYFNFIQINLQHFTWHINFHCSDKIPIIWILDLTCFWFYSSNSITWAG